MDKTLGLRYHRKIAHRRYLQYDGVGQGTTSQRQRAHTQLRLNQSRDSVFDKQFQNALMNNDAKEVGLYSPWPQSTKVTNNLERIANEMIRDSIKRGEFSNLPGHGRPIERTYENPVLSTMEQKVNVMLGSSGFTPDWITLDREVRVKSKELKEQILAAWNRCGPYPMSCSKSAEWEQDLANFQKQLDGVNKRIRDRNLKGPLVGQKVQLKLENLVVQVTADVVPVVRAMDESRSELERSGSDNSFIKVTGFVVAVIVFWKLFREVVI